MKMRLYLTGILGVATIVLAAVTSAQAQPDPPKAPEGRRGGPPFAGQLPSAETIFKRLDQDGDGKVTLDEFKKGHEQMMQRMRQMHQTPSVPRGPADAAQRGPGATSQRNARPPWAGGPFGFGHPPMGPRPGVGMRPPWAGGPTSRGNAAQRMQQLRTYRGFANRQGSWSRNARPGSRGPMSRGVGSMPPWFRGRGITQRRGLQGSRSRARSTHRPDGPRSPDHRGRGPSARGPRGPEKAAAKAHRPDGPSPEARPDHGHPRPDSFGPGPFSRSGRSDAQHRPGPGGMGPRGPLHPGFRPHGPTHPQDAHHDAHTTPDPDRPRSQAGDKGKHRDKGQGDNKGKSDNKSKTSDKPRDA